MDDEPQPRTLDGRIMSTTNKSELRGVTVWFNYHLTDGSSDSLSTITADDGNFSFPLPSRSVRSAIVGAELEGVAPVPFEVGDVVMEPGEIVLIAEDSVPSHLRTFGWA